jgi:hypothetical protein
MKVCLIRLYSIFNFLLPESFSLAELKKRLHKFIKNFTELNIKPISANNMCFKYCTFVSKK